MERMILLTTEQADKVRGKYGEFSALEPVKVVEGLALPTDVIDNPIFESVKEFLQSLPIVDVTFIVPDEMEML